MAALSILIALCFIQGYSLWESCGPYLPYSFAICSIPGESSIFSLNASFAPYEIYRSQNGGESWLLSTVLPSGVKYLSTDYCGRIMVGGLERVVISSDLGETWSDNFTYPNARVRNVSTDPSDSLHMLAAITELSTPLLESFNGGQTWAMPSSSPNNMQGKSVAFSPANPDLIFVAGNRNPISYVDVFRSTNGGATWTDVFNYSYQPGSNAYVNIIAFENPTGPC